jgi:hypothetical protein
MQSKRLLRACAQGLYGEACLREDSSMLGLLWFLLNDDRVFRAVEAVTGCPTIGSFEGRVYRFTESLGTTTMGTMTSLTIGWSR